MNLNKLDTLITKLSDNHRNYVAGRGGGARLLDEKAKLETEFAMAAEDYADACGAAAIKEIESLIAELASLPAAIEQATKAKRDLEDEIAELEKRLPVLVEQQAKARDNEASKIRRKVAIRKMFETNLINPDDKKSWVDYQANKLAEARAQAHRKAELRLRETETALDAERNKAILQTS